MIKHKRKKAFFTFVGILLLLLVLRLFLNPIVKWYLNEKVLSDMGEYTGQVADVDIALIRGAYAVDSLVIEKVENDIEEPFVVIPRGDLSVEWKSLWKGRIVGEVIVTDPTVNFAFSADESQSQTGAEQDWTQVVKDMMPIRINRFAVENGQLKLVNLVEAIKDDISIKQFNLNVVNIQNVEAKEGTLPTSIICSAQAPDYSGNFHATSNANLLKTIPDFDYNAEFTKIDMTSLNPIVKEYAGIDFEKGTLGLFSEMAMNDGVYEGYFKPLAEDMVIFRLDEDDPKGDKRSVGQFVKELLIESASELTENPRRNLFATRVPISGTLDNTKTNVWSTILNIFYNAYIKAFEAQLDNSVSYGDAKQE